EGKDVLVVVCHEHQRTLPFPSPRHRLNTLVRRTDVQAREVLPTRRVVRFGTPYQGAHSMDRKSLLWITALAVAAALGLSAHASASTVKGTVVHANKSAHTFVVASHRGSLTVVSSRRLARAGSVVR